MFKSLVSRRASPLRKSKNEPRFVPVEFTPEDIRIVKDVRASGLTMTSVERMYATVLAAKHVCESKIPGEFVECGVWRGGNSIIAADVFRRQDPSRTVWLYDTFTGMTAPTAADVTNSTGQAAIAQYQSTLKEGRSDWCYASLDDVLANFDARGLQCKPIVGDVAVTLLEEKNLPSTISVLRLDTDWYESTLLELEVLYPRLARGGVLLLDDYGYWRGAKKAVDEYFDAHGGRPFFACTDNAGRVGVKP